jgi:hypothetical protein
MDSYQGMMMMLLQSHIEFEVVTPRTLADFKGKILVLADVKCISDKETDQLKSYVRNGNGLIITGETGKYDTLGALQKMNPVQNLVEETSPAGKEKQPYIYYAICPGKQYSELCRRDFNQSAWSGKYQNLRFNLTRNEFVNRLKAHFDYEPAVQIHASPFISTQTAMVESRPHVFLANYRGLKRDEVAEQTPEENVEIIFAATENAKVWYLPFLGKKIELKGISEDGHLVCRIPAVNKGAVVWLEK